ncbi:MAG: hypothetical protein J4445_01790 [DPANN group archaeon]|nr:hypothetical protein [DPANN group archaeon]
MDKSTLFTELFGNSPTIKVLEFFIENDLYDYSKSDIFKTTGVARTTLQSIIDKLSRKRILIQTRKLGRAKLYKLNRDNPIVNEMVIFAVGAITTSAKIDIESLSVRAKSR